ncbi:hypothetical protein ACFPIJ_57760 [Dactylosporangium cerinum]|uniref:SnoaL-like domain-containing protein n=1 Tax=Dactylosporangium cerinum TaxID=1434730 RepID=A0ABV9WGN9_9ACTN
MNDRDALIQATDAVFDTVDGKDWTAAVDLFTEHVDVTQFAGGMRG